MTDVGDALLGRIERFYDTVPRRFATVEEHGPFTLFLGEPGGWVYYARPRLGGSGPFDAAAVAGALARQSERGLPAAIEWVHETTPDLLAAVRDVEALRIHEIPLMALPRGADATPVPRPDGVTVRVVEPDEPGCGGTLAAARAVADVGFAAGGTAPGEAGTAAREAAMRPPQQRVIDLLGEGALLVAVAESAQEGVLATGRATPVDGVAELVGIATLPAARRRGIGAAIAAVLAGELQARGTGTIFLTASSPEVARVYARVGFVRVGTGFTAERG